MNKAIIAVERVAALVASGREIRGAAIAELDRIVATFPDADEAWTEILLAVLSQLGDRVVEVRNGGL